MTMMAIFSQIYESTLRFDEKYPDAEDYPDWMIDQITEREMQFEFTLETERQLALAKL